MSRHRDEYRQWPFLNQEEFELACALFDQRYVRASLGPTRQIFKIRSRRTATTGISYIEITRLLQPPEDDDDLTLALANLGKGSDVLNPGNGMEFDMTEEDGDEVSDVLCCIERWPITFDQKRLTRELGSSSSKQHCPWNKLQR